MVVRSVIVVAVLSNVDNSKISSISHTVKSNTKSLKEQLYIPDLDTSLGEVLGVIGKGCEPRQTIITLCF